MSSKTNGFAQGTVLEVAYSMLSLTSCVMLARIGLNFVKPKRWTVSDYPVFFAFACYATMCALYITLPPYMQRLYDVANGKIPPYPEMQLENVRMTNMIFAAPCMFWMTLWSIKFSLLCLYHRLPVGLPGRYTVICWSISGVCLVIMRHNSRFWTGGCNGNAAKHAQLVSLYYSFIVDTTTNLMVMALPISLTWNLQMPRSKKIGILTLFATGFICILFACLRVTQVAVNAAKPEADGQPLDPTWLAIWGMVECSIAVIIGCCPAFAVLVNAFRTRVTYDSQGYRKHTGSGTGQRGSKVQLRTTGSIGSRERNHHLDFGTTDLHWADAHSSQEQLRATHDGILVSTTVTHKDGTVVSIEHQHH